MTAKLKTVDLHDAEPEAWKRDKRPDLSRAEAALRSAAITYAETKDALDGQVGPETPAKSLQLKEAAIGLAEAAIAFAAEITR